HSSAWLRSQGYVVNRIDLRQHPNPGSQHFNPILAVRDALMAKDWSLGTSLAQSIAHILVNSSPDAENVKDPFWPQTEMSLITAVILALAEWAPAEQAHLYSLFTTLAESPDGSLTDKWFDDPDRYPPGHAAKLAYSATRAAGKAEQTRAGIFTGAQAALRLFGLPEIAAMTATSDHDLADSGRKLTATFLVVPWHDASRNSIVGLYLSLAVQALAELAERNTGRLPVPVLFLLDEFGNFPAIPNFPTLITVARSAGMRFLMAVQHLEQFEKRYPKAADTITGSANTWVFLRSQGEKTPETISKMMGE
ncbi:MAG: type IV secretory system conjugative DNA transfer family protein, partial [Sulfobacillus sp.]